MVVKPDNALNTDAPSLSRPLRGNGRAILRRAGKRERSVTHALHVTTRAVSNLQLQIRSCAR